MRTLNYFELKPGKYYLCNLDDEKFKGKFVYKLHKHYLVYRKIEGDWDYDNGGFRKNWTGVWNAKWYDDTQSSYKEVSPAIFKKKVA